jgi:hypothetical protein
MTLVAGPDPAADRDSSPAGKKASVPDLQVHRLENVTQAALDASAVCDYYLEKLAGTKISEWNHPATGTASLIRLGHLPVQVLGPTGPVAGWLAEHGSGWHSIGWTVEAIPEQGSTLSRYGLDIHLQTEADNARPVSRPDASDNPLGLTGATTVSVRSHTPEEAAAWLAGLAGGEPYRDERRHLNTRVAGVRLADHNVEFVASLTGSEHDLVGAALAAHGEGIDHVRLATSDFFAARREFARGDVRFTQMGNLSLLLEAEHAGGAIIEIHVD